MSIQEDGPGFSQNFIGPTTSLATSDMDTYQRGPSLEQATSTSLDQTGATSILWADVGGTDIHF